MIVAILQVSLIGFLTWFHLYVFRSGYPAMRVNMLSCCMLACLLVPLVSISPLTFNQVTVDISQDQPQELVPNWLEQTESAPTNNPPAEFPFMQSSKIHRDVDKEPLSDSINWILMVWLIGVIYQICHRLLLFSRLRKIVKGSTVMPSHRFNIAVKTSHETEIPFLYVGLQTAIILPESMLQWPGQRVEHVITHEVCHLKRKDHWHIWLLHLINVVYWFHPLLKYLSIRQRQEIELACDLLVLDQGVESLSYAETILATVDSTQQFNAAISMSSKPKQVQVRIKSVLADKRTMVRKKVRGVFYLTIGFLLFSGCVEIKAVTWVSPSTMIELIGHDVPTLKDGILDQNQVIISALYDGVENDQAKIEVELRNLQNQASWLTLGPLKKFNRHIHTWNFKLIGSAYMTGLIKIKGVETDGVIDGIALGVLSVDDKQNITIVQSESQWVQGESPNMVCSWPLGLSEVELLKLLPQLSENSPDAVERIICGSQLLLNGEYQLGRSS